MANIGLENVFTKLGNLIKTATPDAIEAAKKAAADVYVRAAKAAAPVDTGQLSESVKIIKGRPDAFGERRMYVGPEKKTGWYGRFVESGHMTAGRRRVNRSGRGKAHSQSGVIAQRKVPARPWFKPAVKSAEQEAIRAATEAFNRVMKQKGL